VKPINWPQWSPPEPPPEPPPGSPRLAPARGGWPARGALAMIALAALAGGVAVGAAAAKSGWGTAVEVSGQNPLAAGNLNLELGGLMWRETSPDVPPAQLQSGQDAASLAAFAAAPGDQLVVEQKVGLTADGDNLAVDLALAWTGGPPAGVSAAYRVLDAAGGQLAPAAGTAPLGQPLTVAGLGGGTADLTVEVTVADNRPLAYASNPGDPSQSGQPLGIGRLALSAAQVRAGAGFS
jgi:hypothetical protein